jgi:hypothetical protein
MMKSPFTRLMMKNMNMKKPHRNEYEEAPLQHETRDEYEEAPHKVYELLDEDDEENETRDEEGTKEKDAIATKSEVVGVDRSGKRRKKLEKEGQRPNKTARIEGMMEKFLALSTKQAQDEASQLARENEAREKEAREKEVEGNDLSIKRCISIVNTMDVSKQEKAKAYAVFGKSKENRQTSICVSEKDQEDALIWLRNEMN